MEGGREVRREVLEMEGANLEVRRSSKDVEWNAGRGGKTKYGEWVKELIWRVEKEELEPKYKPWH